MHIKVLFEPENGRLLGAQVVGYDGVDKRLDVFATAIRAGMTVHDLERLELAYAPPYGSAKDPVNMAGFVGSNLIKGDVKFWYAEDFPAGTAGSLIVDVRGRQEYELGHIPGAVNIPLGKLSREGLSAWPLWRGGCSLSLIIRIPSRLPGRRNRRCYRTRRRRWLR
jgi:hypothetical protein